MECRQACAACCIAPSISQPYANMPEGKLAGVPCINLNQEDWSCKIWQQANYPDFCHGFKADRDFCGHSREQALQILSFLEDKTRQ